MILANLNRAELADRLREPGVQVRCGPLLMRVGTSLPELVDPIALLYADFQLGAEDEIPDFEASANPASRWPNPLHAHATASIDGRRVFDSFRRPLALPMFEWAVNWCVFTRPNHHLLLHSAVVERGGSALLLSGQPGAGKSTLTAGLIFNGWRLFSDEVAMLPTGKGDVLALPRPIGLKGISIDIVSRLSANAVLGPAVKGTKKGTVAHLKPPAESVRRSDEPARPRWIVFPRYEDDAPTEMRRVSRAEALLRLGDEAFNYSILGSSGFDTLAGVVEDCQCYSLQFGNMQEAITAIDEVCGPTEPKAGRPSGHRPLVEHEEGQVLLRPRQGRAHAGSPGSLLLRVLREPSTALELNTADWTSLIGLGRHARLLARIALILDDKGIAAQLPARVQEQLSAELPIARQHERTIRWEVGRIGEALRNIDTKLVLLKGAAYVIAGLPTALGRLVSDVDVLVPRGDLRRVEAALVAAGWKAIELHPYDERHYREWSHELPPLEHRRRKSMVDVHHNILPVSGRLHPDADALLEAAVPLGGGLWTLGREDMVLHGAVHLFQDGDLAGAVRDLVDLDSLLRQFGESEPWFWAHLVPRARQMGLGRPLFYALRYASRMLDTPVPADVMTEATADGPAGPVLGLMDRLVAKALLPVPADRGTFGEEAARSLLYVRSHWLRMPPGRLAAHLARKASRRLWATEDAE